MPAYMIIHVNIRDREKFLSGYAAETASMIEDFGGRYVLRAPGAQVLEGSMEDGGSVVISEWPDRAAALRFWNSERYAKAKTLREGIADATVVLVEAPSIT